MTAADGVAPGWLRRAGRLAIDGGETVLWSVAEGRRGRRWRSLRLAADGRPISDLLVEVDPAGRWARLELATAAGILTLHPEPDGRSVHGNVVTPSGMRHVALGWGSDHRVVIEGEPVAAWALLRANPPGAGAGVVITRVLAVRERADVVVPPCDGGANDLPGPSWPLEAGEDGG